MLDGALVSPIAVAPHPQERPSRRSELAPGQEQLQNVRTVIGRFCATCTCSSVNLDSTTVRMQARNRFMCPLVRSERDKCTNRDTRSLTWSKGVDCIVGARWTSQLAWRCKQPGPRSRHNSFSAFMLAASLSLVAILTLSSCSHASLGTHDTSRSAFSRISEVQDSNSCTRANGCSATTKNFAACHTSSLVLSTCAILDLVRNSLALPTSESRTSRDPAVTRPQAATANGCEVSADSCSTCLRSRA